METENATLDAPVVEETLGSDISEDMSSEDETQVASTIEPGTVEQTPVVQAAETQPEPPARDYEGEIRQLRSDQDKQTAEFSKQRAQEAMNTQLQTMTQQMNSHEQQMRFQDTQQIEAGNMTPQQAQQSAWQRNQQYQQAIEGYKQQQQTEQVKRDTDAGLRILAAERMAKEAGLESYEELLKDPSVVDVPTMQLKVQELVTAQYKDKITALEKELKAAKAPRESYDEPNPSSVGQSGDATFEKEYDAGLRTTPADHERYRKISENFQ